LQSALQIVFLVRFLYCGGYKICINMSIPVNVAFTLLIKIEGRLKEFNFRKRNEHLYDVNTNDEYGVRYYFQLYREEETDHWRLQGESLPSWIINNSKAISGQLNQQP